MRSEVEFRIEFVEFIPDTLEDRVLYISTEFSTAAHRCACGCGFEVVTPFSPVRWNFIFNGSVSLDPSIGNWSFPCRSHYWIEDNKVIWATQWSAKQININRRHEAVERDEYVSGEPITDSININSQYSETKLRWWKRIKRWFFLKER